MKNKPLIFISYSRKDSDKITPYISILKENYSIWMDRTGIESSEQFKEKIVQAIKNCDYVLFFSSKSSNESEWTAKEIGIAVSLKKTIIPIKLDSSPYNSSVAFDLVNINYSDDSEEQHLCSLLASLEQLQRSREKKKHIGFFISIAVLFILVSTLIITVKDHRAQARGQILDEYGAVLAHSVINDTTSLIINCTIGPDSSWEREAKDFAGELARLCPEFNAYQYYSKLKDGRLNNSKYLILVKKLPIDTFNQILGLRFFSGFRNRRVVKSNQDNFDRRYPRGGLARRTLGSYNPKGATGRFTPGLEGSFNNELKRYDLRTTLNIDFQEVSENIIQNSFKETDILESVCLSIMDIKSGAIKTIVNLKRENKNDLPEEYYNMYIGSAYEPGALFLPISYAVLLENSNMDINDTLLSASEINGVLKKKGIYDHHLESLLLAKNNTINIRDGLVFSSNGLCKYLVLKQFATNSSKFYHSLDEFELLTPPPFDILGIRKTEYINPMDERWDEKCLSQICCGYGITIAPILLHSFYNAIANDGYYVKPYLVESLEKDGKLKKKLNRNNKAIKILSSSTAENLHDALVEVVANGTATRPFKDSKTLVAGKTGTSLIDYGEPNNGEEHKYQCSFVGYFPADDPTFSILVLCSSFKTIGPMYGGSVPTNIANKVVDAIYNMNPDLIYR